MFIAPLLLAALSQLTVPPTAVWPLDPRPEVVAGFDPPATTWGAGHRGVDLRASAGQPVRAAQDGVVRFAGRIAGRGIVVVDHGSTRTTYEPVRATVRLGDSVTAGTVLGRLEVLGSHCFPAACLHWGLIEGHDTYLDPLGLVGAGPVRLLPLYPTAPGPLVVAEGAPAATRRTPGTPVTSRRAGVRGAGPLFRSGQARGWAWR